MHSSRRREVLKLPLALAGLALPGRALAADAPLIVLQPLGASLPPAQLQAVSSAIAAFYAVQVTLAEPLALPKSAFYAKRQRYRAAYQANTKNNQFFQFLQPQFKKLNCNMQIVAACADAERDSGAF